MTKQVEKEVVEVVETVEVATQDAISLPTESMIDEVVKFQINTVDMSTNEGKKLVYNAMMNPVAGLKDMVNKTIVCKDFIAHDVESINDDTGELEKGIMCLFINENGESYVTTSKGVKNAMSMIFGIFGLPHTWEQPLTFKVLEKKGNNKRNYITVEVV